jgi:hypothetical protein
LATAYARVRFNTEGSVEVWNPLAEAWAASGNWYNPTTTGISGFGIHTTQPNAVVRMTLKPVDSMQNYFNQLKFFLGANENCYELKTDTRPSRLFGFWWPTEPQPRHCLRTFC